MSRERSPFSLFKRKGAYYARFWSDAEQAYVATRATGATNKGQAARIATEILRRGALSIEEVRALIDWKGPSRERAALLLGCLAGMRRGEMRASRSACSVRPKILV